MPRCLTLPVAGACGRFEMPVFRAYNNRAAQNDSNHRYTWRPEIYQEMIAKGWIGEGIGFCLPVGINPWTPRP